jgi:hypothetical protein
VQDLRRKRPTPERIGTLDINWAAVARSKREAMSTEWDARHRDDDSELSRKRGNTLIGTLRKIYGPSFSRRWLELCFDRRWE